MPKPQAELGFFDPCSPVPTSALEGASPAETSFIRCLGALVWTPSSNQVFSSGMTVALAWQVWPRRRRDLEAAVQIAMALIGLNGLLGLLLAGSGSSAFSRQLRRPAQQMGLLWLYRHMHIIILIMHNATCDLAPGSHFHDGLSSKALFPPRPLGLMQRLQQPRQRRSREAHSCC